MPRSILAAAVLGSLLLACATARGPAPCPSTATSPGEEPPYVHHVDAPSRKRGVIVPSDVAPPGSPPPLPAMTQTASPEAPPTTGGGN
jgi:hypothetical protein